MVQYIQTPCDRAFLRNVRCTYSAFCHDSFMPRMAKVSFKATALNRCFGSSRCWNIIIIIIIVIIIIIIIIITIMITTIIVVIIIIIISSSIIIIISFTEST